MVLRVTRHADAGGMLDQAGDFLRSRPVLHNIVLTLLEGRRRSPGPGRYWLVTDGSRVEGVAFNSPLSFESTVTPMSPRAAQAVAEAMAEEDPALTGVNGEASTAAVLAGQWAESTKRPAMPWQGQRLYEAAEARAPGGVRGTLRRAGPEDREILIDWVGAFHDEATPGESGQPEATVGARLPAGHMWVWDQGGPRSMTTLAPPTAGVVRLQAVYTPPAERGRGYAGALVAALSAQALGRGHRPILYTDLGNPVSNSVYRRVGYQCAAEIVRYRFG